MRWFVLLHLLGFLVDLLTASRGTDRDKDVEILLLRHQLRLLQLERPRPPRLSRWEKLTLAVLTAKLARLTTSPRARPAHVLLLFQPDTVLGWHRELVRRKWTTRRGYSGAGGGSHSGGGGPATEDPWATGPAAGGFGGSQDEPPF